MEFTIFKKKFIPKNNSKTNFKRQQFVSNFKKLYFNLRKGFSKTKNNNYL